MIPTQTSPWSPAPQPILRDALARLRIQRFVIAIHQASFPAGRDDLGHGTPYSSGGADFLEWIAALGFTGLMLGPAGITSRDNPSPYDGTALSRNPLHIAPGELGFDPPLARLVDPALLAEAIGRRPVGERVAYGHAWAAIRGLLSAAARRAGGDTAIADRLAAFAAARPWLAGEARYEAIAAAIGHDDWRRWPDPVPPDAAIDDAAAHAFALGQLIVHAQHDDFHGRARRRGVALYGDIPIGLSHRDRYLRRGLFLAGYAMGAPPSRTNPDGQPWGYPVLDPAQLGPGGAARAFFVERLDALLASHDGLRIDHPHGWVCPWVYRTADDPLRAVQRGARLHESPALPELPEMRDHAELAALARVRADQIDRGRPRHADDWVTSIEPAQLDEYAAIFDLLVERTRAHGLDPDDLVIEVLSTCPRPLAAVLARHHLGRFRVTQKAIVDDPTDVYRSDGARDDDWIMVGNHDTPPLASVVARWHGTAEASRRAAYLAGRLAPDDRARATLAEELARDPRAMATAMVADLFVGPARHVQIFWADLFGSRDVYNRPGVVDEGNWSLRVPGDFAARHARAVAAGDAPDLGRALAMAMVARGLASDADGAAIVASLTGAPRG
jgi:4-alpha-glucanotransferase